MLGHRPFASHVAGLFCIFFSFVVFSKLFIYVYLLFFNVASSTSCLAMHVYFPEGVSHAVQAVLLIKCLAQVREQNNRGRLQ